MMKFNLKTRNMKKIMLFLAIISSGGLVSAQTVPGTVVPAAVQASFAAIYPNSKVEKWEKEDVFYEARFEKEGKIMYMTLEPSGEWVNTKTEIGLAELPVVTGEYISKNYKGDHIVNAYKVINAAGGEVSYKVKLSEVALFFNSEGQFKKSEKISGKGTAVF
jgi:hypothetical protein